MPDVDGETVENVGARRLERGELLVFPDQAVFLPADEDRSFLASQRPAGLSHKNISYDPERERLVGCVRESPGQVERLCRVLADFSRETTRWLKAQFPCYARHLRPDRVSYCPVEEATRRIRLRARNDLLHIDSFSTRPANGRRILRVFVNLNLTEPSVWATSETFPRLLDRFGLRAGLPGRGLSLTRVWERLRELPRLLQPAQDPRSEYDAFMLRLHNVLKDSEDFQERSPRRLWTFPAGSAWMCMTDAVGHAILRGRHVLDHSYFVAPESLVLPDESPAAHLTRACGFPVLPCAA
jgi:3-deoxy-D-manno-oct-2-ulosonic acid (Kdo) hydroxylase